MKTNRIRPERAMRIRLMWSEGYTQASIAEEIGCHRNTVSRFLKRKKLVDS